MNVIRHGSLQNTCEGAIIEEMCLKISQEKKLTNQIKNFRGKP